MIGLVSYQVVIHNRKQVSFKLLPIKSSELDGVLKELVGMTTTTKNTNTSKISDNLYRLKKCGTEKPEYREKIVASLRQIREYHLTDNPLRGISGWLKEDIEEIFSLWGINI